MRSRDACVLACVLLANACVSYRGTATDAQAARIASESGWVRVGPFVGVRQLSAADCGAAALSSVLAYFGRESSVERLTDELGPIDGGGLSAGDLAAAAKRRGLEAFVFDGGLPDLVHELSRGRPVIVGVAKPYATGEWRAHYEVVLGIHRSSRRVLTFDPARGLRQNTLDGFLSEWDATERVTLVTFEREVPTAASSR